MASPHRRFCPSQTLSFRRFRKQSDGLWETGPTNAPAQPASPTSQPTQPKHSRDCRCAATADGQIQQPDATRIGLYLNERPTPQLNDGSRKCVKAHSQGACETLSTCANTHRNFGPRPLRFFPVLRIFVRQGHCVMHLSNRGYCHPHRCRWQCSVWRPVRASCGFRVPTALNEFYNRIG